VKDVRQADLSKMISQEWKALTPNERDHWDQLANEKKREHGTLYPNYVYRPQRSSKKKRAPALFVVPAPSPDQAIPSRADGHGDSLMSLKPTDMQLGFDNMPSSAGPRASLNL
jgi:hypothetical protein